jgi:hypothetical protein
MTRHGDVPYPYLSYQDDYLMGLSQHTAASTFEFTSQYGLHTVLKPLPDQPSTSYLEVVHDPEYG